jgi:hypothetical protein
LRTSGILAVIVFGIWVATCLTGCAAGPQAAADCGFAAAGDRQLALLGSTDVPAFTCEAPGAAPVDNTPPWDAPALLQPPYEPLPRLFVPSG